MSLDGLVFGDILQNLRLHRGYTIESLAEGICSIEDLYDFERELKYPTIDQLYLIGRKLNVPLSDFFNYGTTSSFHYGAAVVELIKKYKYERNYEAISEIIEREKNNPIFKNTDFNQFLLWHEGICKFTVEGKKEEAIRLLEKALHLTNSTLNNMTETEIDILTSMAIFEKDSKNYKRATHLFSEALKNLNELPHLLDPKIRLRVLYALAQVLTKQGEYQASYEYCQQGISFCINTQLMLLFPDFHYQIGENLIKLGNIERGKAYMEDAARIFKMQKNENFYKLVNEEMEKLLAKC